MCKRIVTAILIVFVASSSFAQETPTPVRTKTIGSDALILLSGGFAVTFDIMLNDGKNGLGFGSFYFGTDEGETISFLGGGAFYRTYKNGGGRGLFYEAAIVAGSVNWDYNPDSGQAETVDKVILFPSAHMGYRWN